MADATTTDSPATATFTVQLVRRREARRDGGGAASLQALSRPFCLHIDPRSLTLVVANAAPRAPEAHAQSSLLRYFAPQQPLRRTIAAPSSEHRESTRVWLSVRAGLVASVHVKDRMLRVAMHDRQTLRLRVKDASEALEVATAMMDAWGIEPLVETAAARSADARAAAPSMAQLSKLYVHCAQFRALVRDLHSHIEALGADSTENEDRAAAVTTISL